MTSEVRADHHGEERLVGLSEWVDSDLLERHGGTEVERHEFYGHVYEAMRRARAGLPCVAVLSVTCRVDELINVSAVMRRRNGVEEWLDRENVWRAKPRDLDGLFWLPISEEELESLKWRVVSPDWFAVSRWGPSRTRWCGRSRRRRRRSRASCGGSRVICWGGRSFARRSSPARSKPARCGPPSRSGWGRAVSRARGAPVLRAVAEGRVRAEEPALRDQTVGGGGGGPRRAPRLGAVGGGRRDRTG